MAKVRADDTVAVSIRLDNDIVAWLDHIATGAATNRGVVCAVLFAVHVDKLMGAKAGPIAQSLAPAAEGHVTHAVGKAYAGKATVSPDPPLPRWMTVKEFADAVGVHTSAIQRAMKNGTVKRHKEGRNTFLSSAWVEGARAAIRPRRKRTAKRAKRK